MVVADRIYESAEMSSKKIEIRRFALVRSPSQVLWGSRGPFVVCFFYYPPTPITLFGSILRRSQAVPGSTSDMWMSVLS